MICTRTHNAMRKKQATAKKRNGFQQPESNSINLQNAVYTIRTAWVFFRLFSKKCLIRVDSPFNWHEHVQPNKSISCAIFLKNRFISLFKQKKNSNRMALQKFPQITCNLKKSIHIFFAFSFHQLWSHV